MRPVRFMFFETTAVVGIVENGFDSSLVLYPNPSKGIFQLIRERHTPALK